MDPGKRSAATNNSSRDADIAVYLDAMSLGDHSSSSRQQQEQRTQLLQQRYAGPTSPLLVRPVPPRADLQPSAHPLMHQLQVVRQFWPQPPPQRYPWEEGSSSSGGGYTSPIGAAACNPSGGGGHVSPCGGTYSPTLSASASQYQPTVVASRPTLAPQPCTLNASASQYQPVAASRPSVAPSLRTASSSTSTNQYHPFASPYQSGDASSVQDYYRSLHLSELGATQAGSLPWMAPPIRRGRTLEEVRSELHRGPMELPLAMFAQSTAHVVSLLEEGGEKVHQSVLAGVKRNVHRVMGMKEGQAVFVALLRSCEGRYHELRGIVGAAIMPNHNGRTSLLRPAKQEYWDTSVKALITAVARYPDLRALLMHRLLREGVMDHIKGDQLLRHCFTTMRYEDTAILMQNAIHTIGVMLESASGSKCLVECFTYARGDDLRAFEETLLNHAGVIAKGEYSNYFVQHALQHGSDEMKQLLLGRLMEDVVGLSLDRFGSYVVETCFQRTGLLHRVLSAFLGLREAQLGELVQGEFANYVVHKLLDCARDCFPAETLALARRIERLPPAVLDQMYARKVMRVVKKLFPRRRIYG